jgi:hypothetical protein
VDREADRLAAELRKKSGDVSLHFVPVHFAGALDPLEAIRQPVSFPRRMQPPCLSGPRISLGLNDAQRCPHRSFGRDSLSMTAAYTILPFRTNLGFERVLADRQRENDTGRRAGDLGARLGAISDQLKLLVIKTLWRCESLQVRSVCRS